MWSLKPFVPTKNMLLLRVAIRFWLLALLLVPNVSIAQWHISSEITPFRTVDLRYEIPGVWESNRIKLIGPAGIALSAGYIFNKWIGVEFGYALQNQLNIRADIDAPDNGYPLSLHTLTFRLKTTVFTNRSIKRPFKVSARYGLNHSSNFIPIPKIQGQVPIAAQAVTGMASNNEQVFSRSSRFLSFVEVGLEAELFLSHKVSLYSGIGYLYGLSINNGFYGEYNGQPNGPFRTFTATSNGTGLLGFIGMRFYIPKKIKQGNKPAKRPEKI